MGHDIFISYSHKDKTTADAICAYIESKGLRCWYAPRDIIPGADWANSIIEAISSTKIMVLIFTEHSNISAQVLREVSNAVSSGVTIIPFKLTKEEPVYGMKYYLSTLHWLDAMNDDLQVSIESLYVLCRSIIDAKASPKAAEDVKEQSIREIEEKRRREAQRKKKRTIAAILSSAAAVLVIGVLLIILPLNSAAKQGSVEGENDPGAAAKASPTAEVSQETKTPEATEESKPTEAPHMTESISTDPTETYTQGNSQGNLQSGGYLACDGEWYYYRSNDKQCMYKMRPDGSEATKMTYEPVSFISIYDGYIYYYTSSADPAIKRMKTDGTDMSILHLGQAEDLRIVNDRVYYRDSRDKLHLYSMTPDGKDVRLENDLEKTYSWCTDGERIFYSNQNENGALYCIDMNGENANCLVEHKIEGMTIAGNLLYYNDLDTNYFCSYDLLTGEIKELCSDYIYYLNVTKDGIYGYSGTYQTKLCRIQLNGLGQTLLTEFPVKSVCVSGEKIFVLNKETDEYCILDANGENGIIPEKSA